MFQCVTAYGMLLKFGQRFCWLLEWLNDFYCYYFLLFFFFIWELGLKQYEVFMER